MIYFNNIYTLNNRKIRSIKVIREDKSVVEIGDKAYLYVKRNIYPNIKIMDKFVIIDYLKYSLMNKNLDINIFNKVIFFEGLIDVENKNTNMVSCAFRINIVKKYTIIICDKMDEIKNTICHRLYNNQNMIFFLKRMIKMFCWCIIL